MRTLEQLERHKAKVERCAHKYILCNQQISTDLFGYQKKTLITPLPIHCHSYYCQKCGKVKRVQFRKRLKQNLKNDSWFFLTLTTAKANFTTASALEQINRSWNAFLTTIKQKYKNVQYVKVLEISKTESVHLHVIWNIHVPKTRIKKLWERYHKSFIVDVTPAPVAHNDLINYMAKYVDKDMQSTNSSDWYFLHQKRRFSFSRNMEKLAKLKNFKRLETSPMTQDELIKHLVFCLSGDDMKIQDLCLDYIPPGDQQLLIDTFSYTN